MDKLHRLVGAAGFCFRAFGVRIGVRVNEPLSLDRIKTYLPPGWTLQRSPKVKRLYSFVFCNREQRSGIRRYNLLYGNLQNLARTFDEEELLETFESDLNAHIAQAASRRFFVHAGVVEWKGKAIVMPGHSNSGKTTLVKEFLRHGATYYSDEFAVFDSRGYVHPFARPLAIRETITQKRLRLPATELGSRAGVKPVPVGLLLLTRYRDAAHWNPRAISRGKAALVLLNNSLSARQRPASTLRFLQRMLREPLILSGVRGEAKELAEPVLKSLESIRSGNSHE